MKYFNSILEILLFWENLQKVVIGTIISMEMYTIALSFSILYEVIRR